MVAPLFPFARSASLALIHSVSVFIDNPGNMCIIGPLARQLLAL